MGTYSQLNKLEQKKDPIETPAPSSTTQSVDQLTTQSTVQPTQQLTPETTNKFVVQPPTRVVDRPKAFYITEQLDKRIDKAVLYLQERHNVKKVDRSTIVTAMLDQEELWTDEALDQLVGRVVSQLTSRLMGR
jgi:hypothetical protein